ncbi:MAG: hypothetical protein RL477_2201 [Pseudomonadota bacterium]|jgi:O-antigen/teichoic acid export membrane protein
MTINGPSRKASAAIAGHPLVRNAAALAVARGVTLVSGLVVSAWLGRKLGPADYGIIGFATAVVAYFGLIVAIGLETVGARDVARHEGRVRVMASHIASLRLALAVAAFCGLAIFVAVIDRPALVKLVIVITGLSLFSAALNLDFIFQGRARMGVIAGREIFVSLLAMGAVLLAIRSSADVVWAALILVAAPLLGSAMMAARCYALYRAPVPRFDGNLWRLLVVSALPIAAAGILVTIYRHTDMVLLGFLRPAADVGQYAAALKFFTTGLAPVMILLMAFTPSLARARGNAGDLARVTSTFSAATAAVMVPIAAVGLGFAQELVTFLFGAAYAPAASAARLLMVGALFAAGNICFGHPLMLWNLQRKVIMPLLAAALLNFGLNLALIPRFGPQGAAAAVLATEAAMALWLARLQIVNGGRIALAAIAGHIVVAAIAVVLARYLAPPLTGALALPPLLALLSGPTIFVILYASFVGPYWWRRLASA